MLDKELNDTAEKIHLFLKNYCELTKTTPIQNEYNNYYYRLIIQRRVLNITGLDKFKHVLNLGTKIHRFSITNNNIMENNETLYKKINLGVFQHHYCMETYIQHFIYTIIFIFNISINNNKMILLYIIACNYLYQLFYH